MSAPRMITALRMVSAGLAELASALEGGETQEDLARTVAVVETVATVEAVERAPRKPQKRVRVPVAPSDVTDIDVARAKRLAAKRGIPLR